MSQSNMEDVKLLARKLALVNAAKHDGKAQVGSVVGGILAQRADLRASAKDVTNIVIDVLKEVNSLSHEEQTKEVEKKWPDLLKTEKTSQEKTLPPLPNAEKFKVIVTRFSPNPDCALHLGSVRAIILSHDYARMYNGKFILRFEDTDPRLKKSSLQFYEMIREDLNWLGCRWDEEFIQSDRIPTYYEYAKRLLESGKAYVCTCNKDLFNSCISEGNPCPCRNLPVSEQVTRWEKMIDGGYYEGEAVVRIKTDLDHPNPAVRDWPALRIIDPEKNPHPRVGNKYRIWPLYNFAAGIDDHLLGITHIIRGKEHYTNTVRQEYMYKYLEWEYPESIHYGRLKIIGAELSKSKIMKSISEGLVQGFDDPRLATLVALRRRGITPDALRKVVVEIGPRPVDATLSWENIYAVNRKIVDSTANRYFYVENPITLKVQNVTKTYLSRPALHPNRPETTREISVKPENGTANLLISGSDRKALEQNKVLRLMELFNVEILNADRDSCEARLHSETYEDARRLKAPLVHWLPTNDCIMTSVVMPTAEISKGMGETALLKEPVGTVVQLTRFGFARLDEATSEFVRLYFTHE